MKYILFGLFISIGWHAAKLIFEIIGELIYENLHKANWYRVITGKPKLKKDKKKSNGTTMKIGF